ncbi:hypothetical protein AB205_0154880 [Aquarana catesbeiana]|uniref:Anamorsin N-terminal domain-containing protein n=1 Tax=Aquarana catesbeiana TaxID=8400 RepID=A0A2G9S5D0_AQUCT|nr:hypothetical protein AB205_0154880 [Aquarana catesbeiana]
MGSLGDSVSPGQHVAVTWDGSSSIESLQELVAQVQTAVAPDGKVSVENVERLLMSAHRDSCFDGILLGLVPGSTTIHSSDILVEAARILKPGGTMIIQEPVDLQAGEIWILNVALTSEQTQHVKETLGHSGTDLTSVRIRATKPNYEVGSSRPLALLRRPVTGKPAVDPAAVKLWTLSANDMNDEEVDLLDSDDLLDPDDMKKPLPSTLRAQGCGEGAEKKRKACKNCVISETHSAVPVAHIWECRHSNRVRRFS